MNHNIAKIEIFLTTNDVKFEKIPLMSCLQGVPIKKSPSGNFLAIYFQKIFLQNDSGVFLCENRFRLSKPLENASQTLNYTIFVFFSAIFGRNFYLKIRKLDISWPGRHFQEYSMRKIDFSHKNTPE